MFLLILLHDTENMCTMLYKICSLLTRVVSQVVKDGKTITIISLKICRNTNGTISL